MQKKTKVSLVHVKESLQKEQAFQGKRTENDLDQKEIEHFKSLFPMNSNEMLAKQFLISTEDVERLAHKLNVYKDDAYTRFLIAKSGGKGGKTLDGSPVTPGYLITAITKKMTEEERREIMNVYEEGIDPPTMLEELALAQAVRIQRGVQLESEKDAIWRSVNEAIDSLHNILKTMYELKHGQKHVHELGNTFEQMILRSQGKL
ncbi:MAG: hypothetical protein Q8M92_01855 [Candidatus Subteraquimicrobiales bacterium]|nr:hypothetical protein [Candidatus Subteraquimicrobiales bacterium]